MEKNIRLAFAALVLCAAITACTPSGSGGLLPATHQNSPLDTGGGVPPSPKAASSPAP